MGFRRTRRLTALAAVALSVGSAGAGSLEVRVRERGGGPLADVTVRGVSDGGDPRTLGRWGRTDVAGVARFADLAPATYTVGFQGLALMDRTLVAPEHNPYAPTPVVTLVDAGDRVEVDVELWRGARVVPRIEVDRGEPPRPTFLYRNLESGLELRVPSDASGTGERVVVPGRWRVEVDPPPGYLLLALDRDGEPLDGHAVTLDLSDFSPTCFLTWSYVAPALIAGRVTVDGGGPRPQVVAALVEPGPWIEAARARGGSQYREVGARWLDEDDYEAVVPSGLWRVTPVGEELERSEPPYAEVRIEPGETVRRDFTVRSREAGSGVLSAIVSTPDGEKPSGVTVELWSADANGEPLERLAAKRIDRFVDRGAQFSGVAAGDYALFAVHRDFLEVREVVRGFDPEVDDSTRVELTLATGASVQAVATDSEGRRVEGVELTVERLDDAPPMTIEDPEQVAAKTRRTAETDRTGFARIRGLYEGRYVLGARMRGALAATRFVRISRDGSEPQDVVDLALPQRGEARLELQVLPAASVSGSLACTDGGPLPAAAAVRLFPFDAGGGDRRVDPELREGATLALDGLPLSGSHLDTFLAGPLEAGVFHAAVRPLGYGLWTWTPSGEERGFAALVALEIGDTTPLGSIDVECGATLEVRPFAVDGAPLPDLREARVQVVARRKRDATDDAPHALRVESDADRVRARDLTEGEVEVEVRLEHPHFLPLAEQRFRYEVVAERGWLVPVEAPIPGVGGAIEVRTDPGAVAVRVTDAAGAPRLVRLQDGGATVPALAPGSYRVELCSDPDCAEVAGLREPVRVEVGRTLMLR